MCELSAPQSLILFLVCSLARGVSSNKRTDMTNEKENSNSIVQVGAGACTPKPPMNYSKKGDIFSDSKKHQTATKKISSMVRNPSGLREKSRLQYSQTKNVKPSTVKMLVYFTLFWYVLN